MGSSAWAQITDEAVSASYWILPETLMCVDLCQPCNGRSRWVEGGESPEGWGPKSPSTTTSRFTSTFLERCCPSQAWHLGGIYLVHSNSFPVVSALISHCRCKATRDQLYLPLLWPLSSRCACGFSSSSCLCAVSSIQRRNCTPGHDVKALSQTPFCCIYPYKYQLQKEQMAWIYELYYR